jgi:hypothetical protein
MSRPESLTAASVPKGRGPGRARIVRTARALILVLLAGWGVVAVVRDLAGLIAAEPRGPGAAREPSRIALARCEGSLVEARGQARRDPEDAAASLRVAFLELRRAELMALVAYEARYGPDWRQLWQAPPDTARWRAGFLRGDPERCLTRAADAAQDAARLESQPDGQLQALELLATARAALGDPRAEAEALARAVRIEPAHAALWMRLAEACGRSGQIARAESARSRGLALMEGEAQAR